MSVGGNQRRPSDPPGATAEDRPALSSISVTIADHNDVRGDLYELWLPDVDTTVVDSLSALEASIDSTTGVVVLSVGFSDRSTEELLEALRSDLPGRQLLVTADDPMDGILDVTPDEFLVRPLDESTLRSTVETLRMRATYGVLLGRYYSLAVDSSATMIGDDGCVDEEVSQEQTARLQRIKRILGRIEATIGETDRQEVLDRFVDDDRQPSTDRTEDCVCTTDRATARPPRESPIWEQMAAHVWQCVHCGRNRRDARPGNSEIAKRYMR